MKFKYYLLLTFILFTFQLPGQTYDGPKSGSVNNGVIVFTDDFTTAPSIGEPEEKGKRNTIKPDLKPMFIETGKPVSSGQFYFEDPSIQKNESAEIISSLLIKSFNGMDQTNSIPPDPYIAVGPTHIMTTVNSNFSIFDKEGNLVKLINADDWYESVLPQAGAFDPKVLYDHFDKRWIMVWLDRNNSPERGNFLISVSDDSIPTGTWYNWILASNKIGDSTVSNWGDYQGVGFDEEAIYISSNQWQFDLSTFQHVKIRILGKAQLYSNTAGPLTYSDLWNISYPAGVGGNVFNIRPSIPYSSSEDYYLMHIPGGGNNFMSVYKITNSLTNPVLTGVNVGVNLYYSAPQANQLGGSSIPIESGGSYGSNEPKFRDGYLWAVHSIRNPSSTQHSVVRYVKINTSTNIAEEDVSFGAPGFWYIYPGIAVDNNQNVVISYSRSGDNEYIGAFYTSRLAADPPGLSGSKPLQTGKANYVKDFGSGRNRWGDYNGIVIDPSDMSNFWMFTEFVKSLNTWGTYTGELRLALYPGVYGITESSRLDFGDVEAGLISDTLSTKIINWGTDQLTITSIPDSVGPFKLLTDINFPINLASREALEIELLFSPSAAEDYNVMMPIVSNYPNFELELAGNGFEINAADNNIIYAVSNGNNGAELINLSPANGLGTIVGSTLFNEIKSISINPKSNFIYGIAPSVSETIIVRINATEGDAYESFTLPLENMTSIAFDTAGTLYGTVRSGEIYRIDLANKNYTFISKAQANIQSITFHPSTNELWASPLVLIGGNRDRIFKIELTSGDTTVIGNTGFSVVTNAIIFNNESKLFGIIGKANEVNNLIQINSLTGLGALVGVTGFNNITGLAYNPSSVTSIKHDQSTSLPDDFSLEQNYPNPFNPSTTIEFALPEVSNVKLTIYNLLGEVVNILISGERQPGYHKVSWNSTDNYGYSLSSGIYFYELKASAKNGFDFSSMKKMLLIK